MATPETKCMGLETRIHMLAPGENGCVEELGESIMSRMQFRLAGKLLLTPYTILKYSGNNSCIIRT